MNPDEQFASAVAAIDAANAGDPHRVMVRGEQQPKELAHSQLVTEWVRQLDPDASTALMIAARAHHLRRWMIPRSSYPAGRSGYLRWRRALHELHAEEVGEILQRVGYDRPTIERIQQLVAKRGLGEDPEAQVLENALCLVFVETQLHDLSERLAHEKIVDVVRKTLDKMSREAIELTSTIDLPDDDRALLREALSQPTRSRGVR